VADHYRRLAAEMLDLYADRLGNDGCNDMEWPDDWTTAQREQFVRDYYHFNSTSTETSGSERDEVRRHLRGVRSGQSWVPGGNGAMAGFLSHWLAEQAEAAELLREGRRLVEAVPTWGAQTEAAMRWLERVQRLAGVSDAE
jgi:hypothetical protein